MPPARIADPARYDPTGDPLFGPEHIRSRNPHRYEFELLNGVLEFDAENGLIVGVHHVIEDAFWVRGHIPGRPLFPGVLMVELAAQLCSFYWRESFPEVDRFFGFGGIESTRFRGPVAIGEHLLVMGKVVSVKPRRAIFDTQGFVGDRMIFESRITGLPF